MQKRNPIVRLSPVSRVIIIAALVKFGLQLINAPGYGPFFDELYTLDLSRHLALGYVDLPPLVPALLALNRALLGDSLLAMHLLPALAGAATLVLVCLMVKEFGGRTFAVALAALAFIVVPLWLMFNSAFTYDSFDQLILAGFLYTLVRFLRSGNHRLWLLLGGLAGLACLTKMTMLFLGPGFLLALLISKYRRDLLTPWPWLGAGLCLLIASPYLVWEIGHGWPTLEYWGGYSAVRIFKASPQQYFMNIMADMNPLLLPLYLAGLGRLFRRLEGVDYSFLGLLFLFTLALLVGLHATVRLLGGLFMPLMAAGAVLVEALLTGRRWKIGVRALPVAWLLAAGVYALPTSLPILPIHTVNNLPRSFKYWYQSIREFNGGNSYAPITLAGRVGWEEIVQDVADVYDRLPAEERAVAGIYTDWYYSAAAIDYYGPRLGLPRAVSGNLTYYLWGPGDSWEVLVIVTGRTNILSVFFDECAEAQRAVSGADTPGHMGIFVCKGPKLSPQAIWPNTKNYR
jgi:hypothetical protein